MMLIKNSLDNPLLDQFHLLFPNPTNQSLGSSLPSACMNKMYGGATFYEQNVS